MGGGVFEALTSRPNHKMLAMPLHKYEIVHQVLS